MVGTVSPGEGDGFSAAGGSPGFVVLMLVFKVVVSLRVGMGGFPFADEVPSVLTVASLRFGGGGFGGILSASLFLFVEICRN